MLVWHFFTSRAACPQHVTLDACPVLSYIWMHVISTARAATGRLVQKLRSGLKF